MCSCTGAIRAYCYRRICEQAIFFNRRAAVGAAIESAGVHAFERRIDGIEARPLVCSQRLQSECIALPLRAFLELFRARFRDRLQFCPGAAEGLC
jgi:hypothetical protein